MIKSKQLKNRVTRENYTKNLRVTKRSYELLRVNFWDKFSG
jgi:hypothetical protein